MVQPEPPLHGLHAPALHTPPGHAVPLPLLLPSMHTALPVVQSMTPLRHVELGFVVHPPPALQALQKPPLHTPPGHVVPFILLLPSTHTALPVLQLMMPFLHAEPGLVVHAAPSLQALHEPALQTPPAQTVPFGLMAASTQTAAPEEHSTVPSRHAAPGLVVHDAPCVHDTH